MAFASITNSLDIRPGERRLVASLMVVGFLMGLTFVFIQVPALALFVETFGSEGLPPLYIAIAVISTIFSYIYLLIGYAVPFSSLLVLNFSFIIAGTLGIRYVLGVEDQRWPLFMLPIWFEVVTTLGWIGFGTLQNRLFDVRQGRRLLGVVRMMVPAANILGGLTISLIANDVAPRDLFFVSAGAASVLLVILILLILRQYHKKLGETPEQDRVRSVSRETQSQNWLRRRFVLTIFLLIIVWWVAFYFIDNIFYNLLEQEFPTGAEIAGFLGVFFGVVQGSLLLLGNLFTNKIIERIGMRASVLIMPILITLCIGALLVAENQGMAILTLFSLGAAAKLVNGAIGFSVDTNARTLFYQPLPVDERSRIQTMGQGIIEPLAIGLAGVILMYLTGVRGMGFRDLSLIFLGIAALWVIIALMTLDIYPRALKQAISKRRLGDSDFNITDAASIRLLRRELNSPYPEAVIYAITTLSEIDQKYLRKRLASLLDHPSPEVRHTVLEQIEKLNVRSAYRAVTQQISSQAPPEVRQAAVSTLVALGGDGMVPTISHYLIDKDPNIQRGAIAAMLRHAGELGYKLAISRIYDLAFSGKSKDRQIVADVLHEVADYRFRELLHPLFVDEVIDVRRSAVLAAGKMRHESLWGPVLDALEIPGVRTDAVQALVYGGESVLPVIYQAFEDERGKRRDIQARLIRALGRIRGPRVIHFLKRHINYPDEEIRTHILAALYACEYHAREGDRANVEKQIQAEGQIMIEILTIMADLETTPALDLLMRSLQNDVDQTRERIFYLLSYLYDRRAMIQARDALNHGSSQQKAYALEVVDNTIARGLRQFLIPLMDSIPLEQRIQKAGHALTMPERKSHEQHLHELIRLDAEDQNPWMSLYAMYAVSQLKDRQFVKIISETARSSEPLIRETAIWALQQIDFEAYQRLADFLGFPDRRFNRELSLDGEKTVYSTIEKIVILKTISIFEETPSDVLVDIADLMDVVDVKQGETIITKGDIGHSMYVIVAGRMRVHDGRVTLNTLIDRDVFGELALLDPEPRAASVTALEDTTLFRLDQEPFYELIADRGEVARGIMKVLVRTIRTTAREMSSHQTRQSS